ncbi:MAG: DUF1489 domain-containing protein [Rhodospirillales bacterium]|nr:DUF1489 domain-containing protein [Rhodospirillales bacterium]
MLHLVKLAVGARDVADIRDWQAQRLAREGRLSHVTRNRPARAAELLAGGSIYWVVAGSLCVRQRLLAIEPVTGEDGSAMTRLDLEATLVAVVPRAMKPFQGWRYLPAEAAPADVAKARRAAGEARLPEAMARSLRELGLL